METGVSYRELEYEENKEYYNDMKQDVAAALLGTSGNVRGGTVGSDGDGA